MLHCGRRRKAQGRWSYIRSPNLSASVGTAFFWLRELGDGCLGADRDRLQFGEILQNVERARSHWAMGGEQLVMDDF